MSFRSRLLSEMASSERLLSYSLLSLISSTPFQSSLSEQASESEIEDEEHISTQSNAASAASKINGRGKMDQYSLTNNEGAWCWRDDCSGTLKFIREF